MTPDSPSTTDGEQPTSSTLKLTVGRFDSLGPGSGSSTLCESSKSTWVSKSGARTACQDQSVTPSYLQPSEGSTCPLPTLLVTEDVVEMYEVRRVRFLYAGKKRAGSLCSSLFIFRRRPKHPPRQVKVESVMISAISAQKKKTHCISQSIPIVSSHRGYRYK